VQKYISCSGTRLSHEFFPPLPASCVRPLSRTGRNSACSAAPAADSDIFTEGTTTHPDTHLLTHAATRGDPPPRAGRGRHHRGTDLPPPGHALPTTACLRCAMSNSGPRHRSGISYEENH